MANGRFTLGKQSGGTLGLVFPDGVSNTEVVLPESGELATKEYADTKLSKPELISVTGSATFDGLTQKITMTNIGNITLAIGDVIEVTGTTSNNKLFTVESIVDNNNIVVNYEHRGTSTPVPKGRLIAETATATIKLYNRAKNAPLGQGQYWCSPASGRVMNQIYTNNTKREIELSVGGRTVSIGEIILYDSEQLVGRITPSSSNIYVVGQIGATISPLSEYKYFTNGAIDQFYYLEKR